MEWYLIMGRNKFHWLQIMGMVVSLTTLYQVIVTTICHCHGPGVASTSSRMSPGGVKAAGAWG